MAFDVILSLGLLIVVAKLLEGVLRRFRLSSILAYTAAGVALGPVAGLIEPTEELQVLLGIGIFLFFFLIGLDEIDISGFIATIRGRFFVAASLSVLISLLLSLSVTSDIFFDFGLGLDFTEALTLAGIFSLSSLGLVSKVLADEGHLRKPIGIQIFVTVLIADWPGAMPSLPLITFVTARAGWHATCNHHPRRRLPVSADHSRHSRICYHGARCDGRFSMKRQGTGLL